MTDIQGVYASFDLLTPQIADDLWAEGYRVFSQQLWTAGNPGQPANRVVNLRVALDKGFALVGPIAINASSPGAWHVDQARAGVPDDIWNALALAPIDVELPSIPNSNVRDAVDHTVALGKRRCVYCSTGTWADQGNPTDFQDCLLYQAQYDWVDSTAFVTKPPGFVYLVGKQYTNTTDTNGLSTCREVWNQEILTPAVVPNLPEPGPTLEGVDASVQFLIKVAISHEARIKVLEAKP